MFEPARVFYVAFSTSHKLERLDLPVGILKHNSVIDAK